MKYRGIWRFLRPSLEGGIEYVEINFDRVKWKPLKEDLAMKPDCVWFDEEGERV